MPYTDSSPASHRQARANRFRQTVKTQATNPRGNTTTTRDWQRYDAPGRRAELQRLNGAYTGYGYDGISRLRQSRIEMIHTGPDRFREGVSEGGFKETTNSAGEKKVSAAGRPAKIGFGAGLKVTIEVDFQAALYEASLDEER